MTTLQDALPTLLKLSAAAQIAVSILNLFLIRLLRWKSDLERMSLLPRQVFQVHLWFITITLLIFGVITWRFAEEMAGGSNPVATWLAGGVAVFWGVRTVLQVTYYSSAHWRGKALPTIAHIVLLLVYVALAGTYGAAVLEGKVP